MTKRGQSDSAALASGSRMNSLNLDQDRLEALLGQIKAKKNAGEGEDDASLRRAFIRWDFANPSVELRLNQPGSAHSSIRLVATDLSATGIGLLHSNFIYPDTPCEVTMRSNSDEDITVRGKVVRCRHVAGVVHELGVRFETDIDPGKFIENNSGASTQVEAVEPASLAGRVLYIDSSPLDGKLLQQCLADTRIEVTIATSFDDGLTRAAEGDYNVILCDYYLEGNARGAELATAIREKCPNTPIVFVTAEQRAINRDRLAETDANGLIGKPLRRDVLLQTLTEFIAVGFSHGGPIHSTLAPDDPSRELIEDFAYDLSEKAKSLQATIASDDAMAAYATCLQIAGMAPALGFEDIGIVAKKTGETLAASMSVQESAKTLRLLIDCCQRVEAA